MFICGKIDIPYWYEYMQICYLDLAGTIKVVGGDVNASSWSTTREPWVSRSLSIGSQNTIHLHFIWEVKGQDSTTTTAYRCIQMLLFTTQPGFFNSTVSLWWVHSSLLIYVLFFLSGKYLWPWTLTYVLSRVPLYPFPVPPPLPKSEGLLNDPYAGEASWEGLSAPPSPP